MYKKDLKHYIINLLYLKTASVIKKELLIEIFFKRVENNTEDIEE